MSKAATLSNDETQYKSLDEHCLAETQKALCELAVERQRALRRASSAQNMFQQVRDIMAGR